MQNCLHLCEYVWFNYTYQPSAHPERCNVLCDNPCPYIVLSVGVKVLLTMLLTLEEA